MTTEKFKKDKPDIDVFDSDKHTMDVEQVRGTLHRTMESEDERERRHLSSLKPASPELSSVFHQEDPSDKHRLLTPEAQGQVITTTPPKFVPGQGKAGQTEGEAD